MNIQKKRQYDQVNSSTSHISAEEGIRQAWMMQEMVGSNLLENSLPSLKLFIPNSRK